MNKFEKTVITIADAKQSALYFEHIIPVNYGLEMFKSYRNLLEKRMSLGDSPDEFLRSLGNFRAIPPDFLDCLLPPSLVNDHEFRLRLLDVGGCSADMPFAKGEDELGKVSHRYGKACCDLLRDYGLTTTP